MQFRFSGRRTKIGVNVCSAKPLYCTNRLFRLRPKSRLNVNFHGDSAVCPIWCSGMCSQFPIERLRVQFPTIMVAYVILLFLILQALLSFSWVVTNSQCMPEYVVWRVCKNKKMNGKMKKMKNRDSLARKATSISCVVDTRLKLMAVSSSALQAVELCNPSTSCYV